MNVIDGDNLLYIVIDEHPITHYNQFPIDITFLHNNDILIDYLFCLVFVYNILFIIGSCSGA